jgi:hypothetical protein
MYDNGGGFNGSMQHHLILSFFSEVVFMTQGKRAELSEAMKKRRVWCRWKAGQSLHRIGDACGKPHTSIHCLLSHHNEIVPAAGGLPHNKKSPKL